MEGSWNSINQYPRIDMYKTGQNMKNMMQRRGLTVRNLQDYLKLGTPQSIYPVDDLICGSREESYRFFRLGGSFWLRSYYLSYRALYGNSD